MLWANKYWWNKNATRNARISEKNFDVFWISACFEFLKVLAFPSYVSNLIESSCYCTFTTFSGSVSEV